MSKKCLSKISASVILIIFLVGSISNVMAQDKELREMQILGDTLFQKMSIDELKNIQLEYGDRVDRLTREEEEMRDTGLEVTQSILDRKEAPIKDQDKILIRMAEYYIEEADKSYFAEQEKYEVKYESFLQKLDAFDAGRLEVEPTPPPNVKYDYTDAIVVYDKILNEYPSSQFADDALYTKAYLLQQMGDGVQARRIYQEVIDRYPDSHLAAESYMRQAEYYFDPREGKDTEQSIVELQKAIKLYKKVLQYRDSKRYDEALYKLGWSYYRLSATDPNYYSDAIVYFLAVVEDINRAEELDPLQKITNPNVKNEAIQYIGISFADEETYAHAGVSNARKFIERSGKNKFGVDIMRALGETYQKIEKNDNAINAYTNLLEMYPLYEEAPLIKQKIATTYFNLGKDDLEYQTRYELFTNYNPNSDWYATIDSSDYPDKLRYLLDAYKLTEEALRTNLALDLQSAQEKFEAGIESKPTYMKVGEGCKEYLNVFATDSNAYQINWYYALILDEHLSDYAEAYEQYIHVSNDYLETEFQESAANNAIFVADTLRKISLGLVADSSNLLDLTDRENLRPEILTIEEKRLIEAYDNYIRLFPDGENTPNYLAAAGALYFNHKQFAEAKVYFKTLVTRFPGSAERNIAMRSIMESYFALGQFRDSEFIAKRILNTPGIPDEQRVFAEKRLASAIFNNAKLYEDQGQYMEAAQEYYRVYEEAPNDTSYVEAALFNGGQNYDRVKEWERALETYMLLADNYPDSKYALSAVKNTAEDYKELKQFPKAAEMYERLYVMNANNPEQAELDLYNASYYYQQGEDWNNAIRVNNQYITTFPSNPIAIDLFFANAGHYLKLDNLTEANRIFEDFAKRYPDDPRSVQAFYQRGSYYQENDNLSAAKIEYNKAIQKSEELSRKGLDPNRYYVGEALNSLVSMLETEYESIVLAQPQSNIQSQQARLRSLLTNILDSNKKIIANGSIRSFEAVYRNASVYESFAQKYADQERTTGMDMNQQFVEDQRINQEAAALFEKAVEEYKNVITNIPLIAEKFDVDIFSEDTVQVEATLADADYDTTGVVKRPAEVDSTKEVALKWYKMASSKISSLHYKQATLTKTNIDNALASQNPITNDPVRSLIYDVQIIGTVVTPAVQQTIKAHQVNIEEAEELNLSNKYVEESKRQILLTSNIPAGELEKLVFKAINSVPKQDKEYRRLIELEYGSTNAQGLDYPYIGDNNKQMIDFSRDLCKATIDNYARTLALARESGLRTDLVRTTESRMMRIAVELTDIYSQYEDTVMALDSLYAQKFIDTENYNFDDASLYYQDLKFSYEDYTREILDYAYTVKEEYEIKNIWADIVLGKLIAIEPATYAGEIERVIVDVNSGDSWLTSSEYTRGYTKIDFDDSDWLPASSVVSTYNQFASLGQDPTSMWLGKKQIMPDTSMIDSTQLGGMDSLGGAQPGIQDFSVTDSMAQDDTTFAEESISMEFDSTATEMSMESDTVNVYFRKILDIQGTPVDGNIYITADNDFRFFLNEEYIIDDDANNFAVIDTIDYGYLSYYMTSGKNILAIHATDTDKTEGGVKIYGYIEVLPIDLSSAIDAQTKVKKLDVDPILLKKINILNKNRILVKGREE
jgi:cellulose synthase operon protein C